MYSSASAKRLHRVISSVDVRKTFIDYFTINHEHKFVRSSPVVPFCDPTVAFVNAGMNQFKSVFLGKAQPPCRRAVNSQKCIRVGGKHNDISVVGQDGYHHTFFEMLGNWSFGDYFKRETCEMALELLRGPYNIDIRRLYVTYFGGDKNLGLPPDLECYEIWSNLGIPRERILPFGSKDNFWEMGGTGPCGPCTEIHIDHCAASGSAVTERAKYVNAGRPDLTELWNLVFMQYNRNDDGSLIQLPEHHVDTGMGFERLTALLQNKTSNYDTDLFVPLFDEIQKTSKAPQYSGSFPTGKDDATLDTGYRILADHARMVTACLADGMLPDQNQKLRRILRKAFIISDNIFNNESLFLKLIPVVVRTLGSTYPEMCAKQNAILELIAFEQDIFKSLRQNSSKAFAEVRDKCPHLDDIDLMESPGFVPAFRDFLTQRGNFKDNVIPGQFLFKLTDTYGITEESFIKWAAAENMTCDLEGYKEEIANAKLRSKAWFDEVNQEYNVIDKHFNEALVELTRKLPSTDNSYKYNYTYCPSTREYHIPPLIATVQSVLYHSASENVQMDSNLVAIVTDGSNFYFESGGQASDRGSILLRSTEDASAIELRVNDVKYINECVVHICQLPHTNKDILIAPDMRVELIVDADHRKALMCHHTATHLLNGAIRSLFKKVTYQVSSSVKREHCKLEVGIIGKRITKADVEHIEDLIGRVICNAVPVRVKIINAAEVWAENDITVVPGEIYPETGLRLVNILSENIDLQSKELCCGTHVTNTQEIEHFCIINLKQTNRARFAFTAVAGSAAENVLKTAAVLKHRVNILEEEIQADKRTNATEVELQKIRNNILHSGMVLPYAFKTDILERIARILKKLKETARTTLREFVDVEMKNLLQEKPIETHPFILHYISSSALMEAIPLQKATRLCTDRPILVVAMCDGSLKARCCVPKQFLQTNFNAELWLKEFASIFSAQVGAQGNKTAAEVCAMKATKVSEESEEQLEIAMAKANAFATKHLL